jgi:hypothetical protein
LGALLEEDWKPLRTIVIASWDGEEVGPHHFYMRALIFFFYQSTASLVAPNGVKTFPNGYKNMSLPMSTSIPQ